MRNFIMSLNSITSEEDNSSVDPTKLEHLMNDLRSKQSLPLAILAGLVSSLVAALIWAAISYATGYQIGFMAIGVGFLVGFTVNRLGNGLTSTFGIIGAFFALAGCIVGNLLTVIFALSQLEDSSFLTVVFAFLSSPGIVLEIMKETFSPIDLLFYGIAIYEGYKLSIRQVTEEEMASVQRPPAAAPAMETAPENQT